MTKKINDDDGIAPLLGNLLDDGIAPLKIEDGKVFLCCGKANCPRLEKDGDNIKITDDAGNTITLTEEQAEWLAIGAKLL